MSSKGLRQACIADIVRAHPVATQEELARHLRARGFRATQATISRDIKEMGLVKVPGEDGRYRYALPQAERTPGFDARLLRILRDCVLSFGASENIVVIQTLAATAQGVAEAIDLLAPPEVLGTLAGERTVFVVARRREDVPSFLGRLRQWTGQGLAAPEGG